MIDLTVRGYGQEAVRLIRSGQPVAALPLCRRILDAFPKHVQTYGIMGQALFDLGHHDEATDLFRRVLGADPEHTLAHASLSAIYEERGLIDEAIWEMERAFELSPGNREIRRALRRLYNQRSPVPIERIKLTQGALARAYLRGLLYPKAIGELRDVAAKDPNRYDLRVALAEALWHTRRHDQASIVCQGILLDLPNCLKANLILGHIWLNTQRDEEGRALLQRAQSLDPENRVARDMLGTESLLPPRVARLPFRDEDAEDLDPELAYLRDDDDLVVEGTVIEGHVGEPPALNEIPAVQQDEPIVVQETREAAEPMIIEPFSDDVEDGAITEEALVGASWEDDSVLPADEPLEEPAVAEAIPSSIEDDEPWDAEPVVRDDDDADAVEMAPIDTSGSRDTEGTQEVQDDAPAPDGWRVRIEGARRLRDMGALDESLAEYRIIAEMNPDARANVLRDLELFNRLYPGHPVAHALLADLDQ